MEAVLRPASEPSTTAPTASTLASADTSGDGFDPALFRFACAEEEAEEKKHQRREGPQAKDLCQAMRLLCGVMGVLQKSDPPALPGTCRPPQAVAGVPSQL